MKKMILSSSIVIAAMLFVGCSSKEADTIDSVVKVDTSAVSTLQASDMKSIYFDFDRYEIIGNAKETVKSNTRTINDKQAAEIVLYGNTDEWGSDEYNYALGLKRAEATKDALTVAGNKANVKTVSLGESTPVCTDKTKECWSQNRRVDFDVK